MNPAAATTAALLASAIAYATITPTAASHLSMGTSAVAAAAPAPKPVVIELYQSQGCSSCPPALAVLEKEAHRPDVIALNFAVTYWDQLGWKDTFAKPEFTRRQYDYARAGGRGGVSTPQLIIDGKTAIVGGNKQQVDAAIAAARHASGPRIQANATAVAIGAAPGARASTVWLAEYDPRSVAVPIRNGENGGRTLPHRNIVTNLAKLGSWSGTVMRYAIPARRAGHAYAVLVQAGTGGPIIAARKV